jgi:hypothetical protein
VDHVNRRVGTASLRLRHRIAPDVNFDGGVVGTTATGAVRYADVTGGVTLERSALLLAAAGGVRRGDLADGPWGQVRLEYAPVSFTRFEASLGRYPRDLSGYSEGFFAQAGVRFSLGAAAPDRTTPRPPVRAVREDPRLVRVIVRYDRPVSELAIAGPFSDWQPVRLRRGSDGEWAADLAVDPGVHQFSLIADGEWTLPDGVAAVDDGLGGRIGILVVRP